MHTNGNERTADMANPVAKYTDEFGRETADRVVSTGRPVTECCRELGLNPKTVDKWVARRRGACASPRWRTPNSTIGYKVLAQAMESFSERTKPESESLPMAA